MAELKEVTRKLVTTSKTIGLECDNCGKKVINNNAEIPNGCHQFLSSHEDWGSDFSDSIIEYDVCSVKCYIDMIESSIKRDGNRTGFKVDEMTTSFAKNLVTEFRSME